MIAVVTYQVSHDDLRARFDSKMKRRHLLGISHAGVNICLHSDEEQDALYVILLDGHVQEVTAPVVKLSTTYR